MMKKLFIIMTGMVLSWMGTGASGFSIDPEYLKYFRTDSTHTYSWDNSISDWVITSVQFYNYQDGKLSSLVTQNINTRQPVTRYDYSYNSEGFLETLTTSFYSGSWIPSNRNLYSYNDISGQVYKIIIQKSINSEWVDDRIQLNYLYDEYGRQLEFQQVYWRNQKWTLPTTDYSYYDDNGLLIKREAIRPTGVIDYQIIYTYNELGLLSESYAQNPTSTGWFNWWLVTYLYDDCGLKTSQVQNIGSETEWLPSTKVVNYSYFKPDLYPNPKVPVCHNGNTMYVIKKVLKRHLDHGDCIGSCTETKASHSGLKGEAAHKLSGVPFTIYPNPASERITVVRNGYDTGISKVDILDMNGNLLRSETAADSREVTVERGSLISGQYIVRVHGEQVYNLIVVFK